TMADVNVNAPADQAPIMAPPTRTDDQILPHIRWAISSEIEVFVRRYVLLSVRRCVLLKQFLVAFCAGQESYGLCFA
nr:hypothetical protein [Tanacetum cinerariifolium]